MFNLAIDSKLRGCDVVAMKVEDVAPSGYPLTDPPDHDTPFWVGCGAVLEPMVRAHAVQSFTTARVHHASWLCGGHAAARRTRVAAGEAADHRVSWHDRGLGLGAMDRRFPAAAARTRLDRGSHHRDRVSLGGGTQRALRGDRGR